MASAVHSIQRSRYKALIRSLCARHEAGHGGQDGRHDRSGGPGAAVRGVRGRVPQPCRRRIPQRLLRPGLSRPHPTGDWLRHGGSYFDSRVIAETWSKGWQLRYWHAPLERTCEEIFAAGFLIERLWEPRPQPEAAAIDGPEYELLSREPRGFIAFRLISPT
jgi:hypothetical protein